MPEPALRTADEIQSRIARIEAMVRDYVESCAPPGFSAHIKDSLARICATTDSAPEIPIALVGPARVGKSTLINALLGVKILSEDDARFCTAAVTVLRQSADSEYKAKLTFMAREDWDAELRQCRDFLAENTPDEQETERQDRRYYEKKIRTVYRLSDTEPIEFDRLEMPAETLDYMLHAEEVISDNDAKRLRQRLKPFTTSDGSFWPLVQYVEISGPFPVLRSGLQLVDLPGLNDPNPAREAITQRYIEQAPYVWLTFTAKNPLTKDLHELLIERNLLRQFLFEGKTNSFAVIGTHSDVIEYDDDNLEKYSLPSNATHADLVMARNKQLRADVIESLAEIVRELARRAGDDGSLRQVYEAKIRQVPVFFVASREYQRRQGMVPGGTPPFLTEQQSGVPALLDHLQQISGDRNLESHHRSIHSQLDSLTDEVDFFFRNLRNDLEALHEDATRRRTAVLAAAQLPAAELKAALADDLSRAVGQMEAARIAFDTKLEDAVRSANQGMSAVMSGWQGTHHMTLKAIVSNGGRFTSPSSGRTFNFPEELASPLLNAIPLAWDHFFGGQIGEILPVFRERIGSRAAAFVQDLRIHLLRGDLELRSLEGQLDGNLGATKESVKLRCDEIHAGVNRLIQTTRNELYRGIRAASSERMRPAFERVKEERGTGMKRRILAVLESHARAIAGDLYQSIRTDLTEGLRELERQFVASLAKLGSYVATDSNRIVENLAGPEGLPEDRAALREHVNAALGSLAEIAEPRVSIAVL